ncbi:MAG: hypothetical protein ABIW46_01455 [Acidimicrobiales bacterium]
MARHTDREVSAAPDEGDWTVQAADAVERVVGAVRDKTVVPLSTAARAVVFGLLAAGVGATVIVLATIGLVRAVNVLIPGEVWSAYLLVGGIFAATGGFLLGKAESSLRVSKKGDKSR